MDVRLFVLAFGSYGGCDMDNVFRMQALSVSGAVEVTKFGMKFEL